MTDDYKCQYCGQYTGNLDFDYLSGTDHLSCVIEADLEKRKQADPIEKCVMCGIDTQYHFSDHVDRRVGYIEGAGQLCTNCYSAGTDRRHMTVPMHIVYNTPNDQELGAKIRKLYYESKDNS